MKKIIIIPAYNEEENIERTVNAIQKSAQGFDYVIINRLIIPEKYAKKKSLI